MLLLSGLIGINSNHFFIHILCVCVCVCVCVGGGNQSQNSQWNWTHPPTSQTSNPPHPQVRKLRGWLKMDTQSMLLFGLTLPVMMVPLVNRVWSVIIYTQSDRNSIQYVNIQWILDSYWAITRTLILTNHTTQQHGMGWVGNGEWSEQLENESWSEPWEDPVGMADRNQSLIDVKMSWNLTTTLLVEGGTVKDSLLVTHLPQSILGSCFHQLLLEVRSAGNIKQEWP